MRLSQTQIQVKFNVISRETEIKHFLRLNKQNIKLGQHITKQFKMRKK